MQRKKSMKNFRRKWKKTETDIWVTFMISKEISASLSRTSSIWTKLWIIQRKRWNKRSSKLLKSTRNIFIKWNALKKSRKNFGKNGKKMCKITLNNFTKGNLRSPKGMKSQFNTLKRKDKTRRFCTKATSMKSDLASKTVKAKWKILKRSWSGKKSTFEKRRNTKPCKKKWNLSNCSWRTKMTCTTRCSSPA